MAKRTKEPKDTVTVQTSVKQKLLSRVFGDPQKKKLKVLQKRVAQVNALAEKYKKLSNNRND